MSEYAIFAAGCFWGVQYYFSKQEGVIRTVAGYIGGNLENPSYSQVKSGKSGHLEAVMVEYDPERVSYEGLCRLFFEIHDPGQTDGQGPDTGSQYLSGIFYLSEEQKNTAVKLIEWLRRHGYPVYTVLEKASIGCGSEVPVRERFWPAEDFHQLYYDRTGGTPYCHFRTKKFD